MFSVPSARLGAPLHPPALPAVSGQLRAPKEQGSEIKKNWLNKQRASESWFLKPSGASLGGSECHPGRTPQVPFFGHIREKEDSPTDTGCRHQGRAESCSLGRPGCLTKNEA